MKRLLNPYRSALFFAASIVFLVLAVLAVQSHKAVLIIIYSALCLFYIFIGIRCLSAVIIDKEGVKIKGIGTPVRSVSWAEISEVYIANLRVIKNSEKNKIGQLYLCFAPDRLLDEEKMSICLNWPPKDMLYVRFSPRVLKEVKKYWQEDVSLFWIEKEVFLDKYYPH